jgi:nucleotide-binding universal stress UspA family protein
MGVYDDILVPTDGSAATNRAVDHAVELAGVHDATLHALYVVNTATFASLPMESSFEGVASMLDREGEAALDAVESIADEAGVRIERSLVDGSPAREIVRYAEDEGCDLVIMGTHGRGGIDRLLLGSVTERVVRSSNVPVLTIRAVDEE